MAALDEVVAYISQDSPDRAGRVLTRALDTAASLSSFAERGRIVREVGDPALRQLLVYDYRLMYRVHEAHVVIRAFVHGTRDFATWRQEEAPKL
jgi:plasmid stabilization system protein ParE